MALILALLFRSFEAEAFVIPTGSMAPTLTGKHKDLYCEQCGQRFQAGDVDDSAQGARRVTAVTCPQCRYVMSMERGRSAHQAYSGDRILVNKYIYTFSDPKRWDVIVFKYPGNAKQNYIKRLVGLPQETVRIRHGDVHIRKAGQKEFTIARKTPEKLLAMAQLVHDSRRVPAAFPQVHWPSAWFPVPTGPSGPAAWQVSDDQRTFQVEGTTEDAWLRFQHLLPSPKEWDSIRQGELPASAAKRRGELISDFYAYNAERRMSLNLAESGVHWVGDLVLEADIQIRGESGELALDLVEGGDHFECRIDVATGKGKVTIPGGIARFTASSEREGEPPSELHFQTSIHGSGNHHFRWANVDDQLTLWVDRRVVPFMADGQPHSGTYIPPDEVRPKWSTDDAGDLNPLGIAARGLKCSVSRIRVLRDIYYIAISKHAPTEYRPFVSFDQIRSVFQDPASWSTTKLFSLRTAEEFTLEADQFFPMGDNSPSSSDGRLWNRESSVVLTDGKPVGNFVPRELLIGKAFLVYWPHGWNLGPIPIPIVPNVSRMGRIK